jgi:hypothetical protein
MQTRVERSVPGFIDKTTIPTNLVVTIHDFSFDGASSRPSGGRGQR